MEKIKTSKQRILVATLTLCMLFTLFAPAANVNAASKRTKALTAYQKKLTSLDSRYNKFALIYLNKDSIPELLITPKETVHIATSDVYVYTGGKLKKLNMPEVILEDLFILEKNLSYVILDGLTAMELSQHFIALRKMVKKQS